MNACVSQVATSSLNPACAPRAHSAPPALAMVSALLSLADVVLQGTHSALSGLIAMLVAVDILSAGRGEGYSRDLVFLSLSGEAYDLIGSRQLLFNLDSDIGKHGESVAGLHKGSIAALIEVGMLGRDPGVGNDTAADAPVSPRDDVRREVFLHQVGDDRLRVNEAFQSAVRFERAPTVRAAKQMDSTCWHLGPGWGKCASRMPAGAVGNGESAV